jgi:hypothetical protein
MDAEQDFSAPNMIGISNETDGCDKLKALEEEWGGIYRPTPNRRLQRLRL